jgi:2-oxoisovalerate dehydrogenase E1 component beta subunit
MVYETLAAADALAAQGIAAEVIDVATLKPLDMDSILASVARTGRCVIVSEAARTAGFAAEIAANLADDGLLTLRAPVLRVTGYDTVVPLARLENRYLPSTARILKAINKVLEFS